jgi:ABC-type multidrug transport system fused ATPase/permease subunit
VFGRAKGEVELERVSFGSLSELSLRIPAGACVALIGGAEIVALVTGRRRPDSGRVLIDGGAWVVGPRTDLVAGTVAENIAYGTAATREQVVGASKGAGAHSFVSELPEHYDSSLGEGGVALSGGQRQRIGIARALLRDPPIVVLEEPTRGLDPLSEARVVDGLRVLMRGRTTILVTRSPALASIADRVVVIEDGRVVRDGPPQSLLEHPARRPSAPLEDPALPALGRLLDAEAMAGVLEGGLGRGAPLPDVRGSTCATSRAPTWSPSTTSASTGAGMTS